MTTLGLGNQREYTTDEVFGINRDLPLNYVDRDNVDQKLIDNLSREKHIVIYGSSKQGKTSLRKHCLQENDYIVVQCGNKWGIEDILSNILKRAGFKVTQSEKKTVSGRNKILASLSASLFRIGGRVDGEKESSTSAETTSQELELDPSDVNDVIAALRTIDFDQYVVLEDFHYLPTEAQKDFAVALKAFHEASKICFIIVGVWLEENRLVVYNGDLTGRLIAIDADRWTENELRRVIKRGEQLLNVSFDPAFDSELIKESYGSVYIVQEVCRQACIRANVYSTKATTATVGEGVDTKEIVKEVVDQQGGRYKSFLSQFASGFQETRLQMYKWLLYPILAATPEKLEEGFKYPDLRRAMQEHHPLRENLNIGNLTQALQSVASLQVAKDIKPIILDYDQTNSVLNVVDRGFVIWLQNQDKAQLFEELDLPQLPDAKQLHLDDAL
ncbi:MAG TPA: hypothetical protein VFW44_06990 [Bryobacteraceae bacterium]|nr:hypothetical protein [Bryobacteraceae bacterium]